jgi:cytochrome c oxidase accessory protein FixG
MATKGPRLPLYDESLHSEALPLDGIRKAIQPADVHGRFNTVRRLGFALLIGVWILLPWLRVGGHPALFIDIERRTLYLLGATFNAQDTWMMFFLVTGAGFSVLYVTTLLGRVWCGWACPQTVFLEGVYRRVERWIEGPRERRMHRNDGPWNLDKVLRKVAKQVVFVAISFLIAHIVLAYFVSLPKAFEMMRHSPGAHPEAFVWATAITVALYVNFAWFREQFCVVLCPYGRLQSVLTDPQSLFVGYDAARGEPRGKKGTDGAGACVDCKRCLVVCPTGVDIRKGVQLECIGCTACIDACDDVMDRLERPRGLIRYDSLEGLSGRPRRIVRPRVLAYTVLGLIGATVAFVTTRGRTDFEVNLLRLRGAPFTVTDGAVQNSLDLHIVNKIAAPRTFHVEVEPVDGMAVVLPLAEVTVPELGSVHAPVFLTVPSAKLHGSFPVHATVVAADGREAVKVSGTFIAPVPGTAK